MASQGYTTGDLALYTKQVNVGRSEKSGLDMEIQWRQPTDWGRFNLSAKATYMLRSNDQADATSEQSSDIGRFNAATGTVTPRVQARITGGLTNGAWSTTLVLQHVSGYLDANVLATDVATGTKKLVGGKPVRSFTTLDAFASWAIQRNVSLHLGVRNVFDQDAPQTFASSSIQVFGANTRYANLWGRTLQLGMTARF
jgi:iron complex outermembrane receptor protein